ncbi:hypothetical protein WOLCODRAFT_52029, partial [Wolfiporia cocos MD-104 SS10]
MHLPHSVFSRCQLDLFPWLLKVNSVNDVPSVHSMLKSNAALQQPCGIESKNQCDRPSNTVYDAALYQEMANPKVHPYLHFLPEDRGARPLVEAHQAKCWLEEIPDNQLTPMMCICHKDFYIHEPAMLSNSDI